MYDDRPPSSKQPRYNSLEQLQKKLKEYNERNVGLAREISRVGTLPFLRSGTRARASIFFSLSLSFQRARAFNFTIINRALSFLSDPLKNTDTRRI
jgi:hypothetical protein